MDKVLIIFYGLCLVGFTLIIFFGFKNKVKSDKDKTKW